MIFLENVKYERHSYEIYKSKELPFICHKDHLNDGTFDAGVHWHENPEFLMCTNGRGEVLAEAEKMDFCIGDIVCINPNEPHSFSCDYECGIDYDCLIIDVAFCKENGIDIENIKFSSKITDKKLSTYYERAFSACMNQGEFQSLTARTYVLEFLLYMCKNYIETNQNKISVSGMEEIKKAVTFVRNNYKEPITLEQAAEVAGFSVYYFSREFKKVTGATFVTFLNTVRCRNAAKMLRKGATVTEACFSCGFKELSYFSRTFSKIMGVSPSNIIKT